MLFNRGRSTRTFNSVYRLGKGKKTGKENWRNQIEAIESRKGKNKKDTDVKSNALSLEPDDHH